jgi:hypothetical protein
VRRIYEVVGAAKRKLVVGRGSGRGFIRRPGSTTHLFGPGAAGWKSRLWVDPRWSLPRLIRGEGDNEGRGGVPDVAQGLRSGPAALPAVRVLAAPHTR